MESLCEKIKYRLWCKLEKDLYHPDSSLTGDMVEDELDRLAEKLVKMLDEDR